jgi:hypothetical protein
VKFIGILIVWLAALSPAQASTVTLLFNGPPTGAQTENGYSFVNSSSYSAGGTLDLHDDSGGLQSTSFARTAGGYFNALSVDMRGYQRLFVTGATPSAAPSKLAFNNYQWNGYRNGTLMASASGSLGGGSMVNYLFDQTFSGLSTLQLNLLAPGMRVSIAISGLFGPSGPNQPYCQDYCTWVSIDNLKLNAVQLSPVPLPAGFGLLASVLGVGAVAARWRKRRA